MIATHRLTADQVNQFRTEGYLLPEEPVFTAEKFGRLRDFFETILADLPADTRPEALDVPHFVYPELFEWAFAPEVLGLVEPIIGPDLALFSTHFICKPKGNGKRVPWHEDSAYWGKQLDPMEVVTVWIAIDASNRNNGGMKVIPRTHVEHVVEGRAGFSDYEDVNQELNIFPTEIVKPQRDDSQAVYLELEAGQCSLHDARIQHGSDANTSDQRRCGWTLRFIPTTTHYADEIAGDAHMIYLAQGVDHAGNKYADPTKAYPEALAARKLKIKHSH